MRRGSLPSNSASSAVRRRACAIPATPAPTPITWPGAPSRRRWRRRPSRAPCSADRSVLDTVSADAMALQVKLGPADRTKLDQYLTSVRELEQRLEKADAETAV